MNIWSPSRIVVLVFSVLTTLPLLHAADSTNSPGTTAPVPASSNSAALPADVQSAMQLPEGPARVGALAKAAVAWAKQDPHAALTCIAALPYAPSSMAAIRPISNMWGDSDPVAAKDWVLSQYPSLKDGTKDDQLALLAFHLITTAWARKDPAAAVAWATSQPDTSPLHYTIYFSVADGWAQNDPAAGAAWTAKLPDEKIRHSALSKVADIWGRAGWAKGGAQPEAAAAWAEKLPPTDIKFAAAPIAMGLAKKDAEKAKAWVNSLPLSDADKAEILGKIK